MTSQRYALLSVSNKQDLERIALALSQSQYKLLATGNTARYLSQHNISSIEISDFTNQPEMLGGRVKTLHPKIHGGILARSAIDSTDTNEYSLELIDFVIVNLYPFCEVISKQHNLEQAIENIDIGGPTLLRAAAKNFDRVTAICDHNDYSKIIAELEHNDSTTLETRKQYASKVFKITSNYDANIYAYLAQKKELTINACKQDELRYGENPQQTAARYALPESDKNCIAKANSPQGKQLSFNNLLDSEAAWSCVCDYAAPSCVIVKHNTPCGIASASNLLSAYNNALACDTQSAFGGIIACNRTIEADLAQQIISKQFVEVIIATGYSSEAKDIISSKPNCRVLTLSKKDMTKDLIYSIDGGFLMQSCNKTTSDISSWKNVTTANPTKAEMADLEFAWNAVKHVKSNAIVFAKDLATIGIGCGQTSRVFSLEIAALKAKHAGLGLNGAVMASDAFFPFADAIELAAKLKISAIIQPGGSKRDSEVIECANKHNIAMLFTGVRNFKH